MVQDVALNIEVKGTCGKAGVHVIELLAQEVMQEGLGIGPRNRDDAAMGAVDDG